MKKRIISIILSLLLVFQLAPAVYAQDEPFVPFGLYDFYSTAEAGATLTDSFFYSDAWFRADPSERNDALALASMQFTAAACDGEEDGLGASFLQKLGFSQIGHSGFGQLAPDTCSYTWGTKTIGTGNDAFTLVAIAVQSYSLDKEVKRVAWTQNFRINGSSPSAEHAGFAAAADTVIDEIKSLGGSGKVKYWITGQSRGGALADMIAVRLAPDGNDIFAYSFEAPASVEPDAVLDHCTGYPFIHNYLCSDDLVTMIPPWGMVRYGAEYLLDTEETNSQLAVQLSRLGSAAAETAADYDHDKAKDTASRLLSVLTESIPQREDYSSRHTDTFQTSDGSEVSITYVYQDLFIALIDIVFGDYLEGFSQNNVTDHMEDLLPAVNSLYLAVRNSSDADYYDAARKLNAFLHTYGLNLPLTDEDIYVLLKLVSPALCDTEYVSERESFMPDDILYFLMPAIGLLTGIKPLILSHQNDSVIARLKTISPAPLAESLSVSIAEPAAGDSAKEDADNAAAAFDALGYPWLTASVKWESPDETLQDNRAYYLNVTLTAAGPTVSDDYSVKINEKDPVKPLEITYSSGSYTIRGTWAFTVGTPAKISVSFDTNGYTTDPEPVSVDQGSILKYVLTPDDPGDVSYQGENWRFKEWQDENGSSWENITAEEDLTLYAIWIRLLDQIEITYEIPHVGEEAGMPVSSTDLFRFEDVHLVDEEWEDVAVIENTNPLILSFRLDPDLEKCEFLIGYDADGDPLYAGSLTINGEEPDLYYDRFNGSLNVEYHFTPLPKEGTVTPAPDTTQTPAPDTTQTPGPDTTQTPGPTLTPSADPTAAPSVNPTLTPPSGTAAATPATGDPNSLTPWLILLIAALAAFTIALRRRHRK